MSQKIVRYDSTNTCFEKNRSHNNDEHKNQPMPNYAILAGNFFVIPKSDTTLDLSILGHDDNVNFRKALIPLLSSILPGWNDKNDIRIERVGGAFTNCMYFVTMLQNKKSKPLKVVLRIYGHGADQLCNRVRELDFVGKLSTLNIGPKLLGIFANGRFEEYLESRTLTKDDLPIPETSRLIAERMSQLHNVVNTFPPPTSTKPQAWANIDNWYILVLNTLNTGFSKKQRQELKEFNFESLKDDIEDLKIKLSFDSPIVFAHNDTQYGNILELTGTGSGQLVMVDFEYSGYNYREFDIANHFCEWMFDYHSSEPHKMNLDWYPDNDQQINFLQSYLETEKISISKVDIHKLQSDVKVFTLASHVMWGIWGLIQSGQSEIDFNYFEYGMQRLKYFRDSKNEIYKNLLNNRD